VPLSVIWYLHATRRRLRTVSHRQAIGHKQITACHLTRPRCRCLPRATPWLIARFSYCAL